MKVYILLGLNAGRYDTETILLLFKDKYRAEEALVQLQSDENNFEYDAFRLETRELIEY